MKFCFKKKNKVYCEPTENKENESLTKGLKYMPDKPLTVLGILQETPISSKLDPSMKREILSSRYKSKLEAILEEEKKDELPRFSR